MAVEGKSLAPFSENSNQRWQTWDLMKWKCENHGKVWPAWQTDFITLALQAKVNNTKKLHVNVSFHSRSQGSQASQQACVCDAYWYGNMVETHSATFWEGLRDSQSSRTCSTLRTPTKFLRLLQGMKTKNAGSQCSLFWGYIFGLTLLCER